MTYLALPRALLALCVLNSKVFNPILISSTGRFYKMTSSASEGLGLEKQQLQTYRHKDRAHCRACKETFVSKFGRWAEFPRHISALSPTNNARHCLLAWRLLKASVGVDNILEAHVVPTLPPDGSAIRSLSGSRSSLPEPSSSRKSGSPGVGSAARTKRLYDAHR